MDATFEAELETLVARRDDQTPSELFGEVSDDFWLWINTEGRRRSSALAELLPGLPEEQVQRQCTSRANDDTLIEGFNIYRMVRDSYRRHVGAIAHAEGVLDFGCGWGRVIRFFLRDVDHRRLHGVDNKQSLVDFCRNSNRWCNFTRNEVMPPLPIDDRFSCIFAYSVFSHLSEEMHLRWLQEFKRILRPEGALVISVRPRNFIERCRERRESKTDAGSPILAKMFPDADGALTRYDAGQFCYMPYDASRDTWRGEACIPKAYIERVWARLFEVREFVEARPPIGQHLVILKPYA